MTFISLNGLHLDVEQGTKSLLRPLFVDWGGKLSLRMPGLLLSNERAFADPEHESVS